jgi:hypothetical protein
VTRHTGLLIDHGPNIEENIQVLIHILQNDLSVSQQQNVDAVDGVRNNSLIVARVYQFTNRGEHISDQTPKLHVFKHLGAVLDNNRDCVNRVLDDGQLLPVDLRVAGEAVPPKVARQELEELRPNIKSTSKNN